VWVVRYSRNCGKGDPSECQTTEYSYLAYDANTGTWVTTWQVFA
jgi:hypothetical protein